MARTMIVDNTEIYRALVSRKHPSRGVIQKAYGPHDSRAHAQDYDSGFVWPARVEKQVLEPQWIVGIGNVLEWHTIDTKYTNGGEDVNWDD